jgi:ribose transport system substrate-binding protein
MSRKSTPGRTSLALVGVALVALLAAGCSEGTADGDSAVQDATSDTAKEALEAAFTGTTGTTPSTPTTPKPGVNLWVVSCGEQVPSCATPAAAAVEAAEVAGWTAKTCDGQLNPDGWGNCVRQATSAGADVIIPIGIDCPAIQQPFEEAKQAGVKVIGGGGADCDSVGGEKLWASERLQIEGLSVKDYWAQAGATAANYLIGSTDGAAKVLEVKFTDPLWGPWLSEGFTTQLATCEGCEVVDTLELANNDFISGTATDKFASALQKAADANAVYVPVGGWMPTGFAQAVVASGRQADLVVASGFGNAANMELIRTNTGQNGVLGYATEWGGWGSVDTAIRVLNGEEPVVEGDGFQMVDADNNLPAAGEDYQGNVDFKSEYKALWGVS